IVGVRELPLARDPTVMYDEHVAWIAAGGGGWVLVPLKGTDPNLNEGAGFGVADRTSDGSTIVAGFSWENTSGPGGKQWAVVWRRARGATAFDPPVRLQPLSKTGDAMASGVNTRGEVVGIAWTGSGSLSVMWRLPAVP
ncbi:MAG TPA: hypothetical protein VF862_13315, partial [Gemmatimonadales bacterium]